MQVVVLQIVRVPQTKHLPTYNFCAFYANLRVCIFAQLHNHKITVGLQESAVQADVHLMTGASKSGVCRLVKFDIV